LKLSISSPDFSKIFNNSKSISCNQILFKIYKNNKSLDRPLIGFAINKKLGAAHQRNLFKRRSKHLFNNCFIKNNKKIGMIIIPKSINLGWNKMCDSFELLQKKLYNE
tara:strand:- start:14 stop:337 length:324 start_codon:yes stop_codon:yes gene_type:complete